MLKKVLHTTLLTLTVVLAGSITSPVHAQKTAAMNGAQSQEIDVERAYLRRYQEMAALPVSERRALFVQSSAAEKSSLWRVHLALTLAKRSELNNDQREVVLEAISLAIPELFSLTSESPLWKTKVDGPLQLLRQHALGAYSKQEAAAILSNISDDEAEITLLQKYTAISALSLTDRKALFAKSVSKDKSDLWRVHLALYLAQRPTMKKEQREVILDAISLATPELFSLSPDNPLWKAQVGEPLQLLNKKALVVFSKSEGAEFLNNLGGRDTVLSGLDPDPDPSKKCNCSHDSDWCILYDCFGTFCKRISTGCGTFWMHPCTGLCSGA